MRIPLISLGLVVSSLLGLAGCGSDTDAGPSGSDPVEITFTDGSGDAPRFSPDGTKIAFIKADAKGDNYDLTVMTSAGEQPTKVAAAGSYLAGPAWAPDGKQIYFTADAGLSLVAASGGAVTVVADAFAATQPDVSPDGKSIVYASNGSSAAIVDLADPKMPKTLSVVATTLRFSPDGKSLAFVDTDDKIKLMDVASGMVTDVIDAGTYLASLDWFADGKRLAITSDKGIEIVTLGATPARSLVRDEFAAKSLDLSPDGKTIAYAVNGQSSIFLLTGF